MLIRSHFISPGVLRRFESFSSLKLFCALLISERLWIHTAHSMVGPIFNTHVEVKSSACHTDGTEMKINELKH